MRVVLLKADVPSIALDRIDSALMRYAPSGVSFTDNPTAADVVVVPVIGRRDSVLRVVQAATGRGQRVVLAQYCLRSTMREHTEEWREIWDAASLVWSYYDIPACIAADGGTWGLGDRFYHSPLGADSSAFVFPSTNDRPYVICSSGRAWLTESARECAFAALAVGRRAIHLGPDFPKRPWVDSVRGLSDAELATDVYGRSEWVSGLRRIEGFELPAIEGLLCGARPVLFDRPHYRRWFDGFADFIPERERSLVIEDLTVLFERGARPVSRDERDAAATMFSWKAICTGFWERV